MTKRNVRLVATAFFSLAAVGCVLSVIVSPHGYPKVKTVDNVRSSALSARGNNGGKTAPAPAWVEDRPGSDLISPAFRFPAPGTTVSDEALLRLCALVNIANSVNEPPDPKAWHKALPVAQKLLTYPCDCAQRNWLSHFVELGNYALSGSQNEYNASAQVLVTLGRNNDQAVALSRVIH